MRFHSTVYAASAPCAVQPSHVLTAVSFAPTVVFWLLACVAITLPIALVDVFVDGELVWGPVHHVAADGDGERGFVDEHWCEHVRVSRFVRTRFNGYTTLFYAYVAALLPLLWYWRSRRASPNNSLQAHWGYTAVVVGVLLFGTACSFSYHASVVHEPFGRLDRASVAALVLVIPLCFALTIVPGDWKGHGVGWVGAFIALSILTLPHFLGDVGTGESTYNLVLIGVSLALSALLLGVYAAFVRPLGCSDGLTLLLALSLGGGALALRDPAAIGACRPKEGFAYATHGMWYVFSACAFGVVWFWAWRAGGGGESLTV